MVKMMLKPLQKKRVKTINKGGDCNKDVIPNKKRDGKEDVNEREDGEKNIVIGKGHEGKQYDKVATEGVATDEAGDGI